MDATENTEELLAAELASKNAQIRTLTREVERLDAVAVDLRRQLQARDGEQLVLGGVRIEEDVRMQNGALVLCDVATGEHVAIVNLDTGDGPPRHRVEALAQIVAGFTWPGRGSWLKLTNRQREAALDGARRALDRCAGVE